MPIVIIFFIFIMSLHTLALREYPPSWQDSSSPLPYFSKSLCWSLPTSLVTYGLYSYPFFFCQLLFFLLENFHLKIKKIKAFFNDIDMCVFSFALEDTILETIYSNTSFEKVLQTCSRLIGKGEKHNQHQGDNPKIWSSRYISSQSNHWWCYKRSRIGREWRKRGGGRGTVTHTPWK